MIFSISICYEFLVTKIALEWLLACVGSQMLSVARDMTQYFEAGTVGALVALHVFCHVFLVW